MTDLDIAALKATANAGVSYGNMRCLPDEMIVSRSVLLALIERLEKAEALELEKALAMQGRLEKLEAVAKAARQFADDPDYESDDFADDIRAVLVALEAAL